MATNPDREVCHRPGRGGKMLVPVMAVLVAVVLASLPSAALATNYTVGDEKGWKPKVDYTSWVKKHRPFYKGDWLLFEYQNGRSDVVQVDEVGYDNCDKKSATSYSKGTSYAFQLKEAKDYFICSYGYCYSGMKLALTAKKGHASSSPDSSSSSRVSKSSSKSAGAPISARATPLPSPPPPPCY